MWCRAANRAATIAPRGSHKAASGRGDESAADTIEATVQARAAITLLATKNLVQRFQEIDRMRIHLNELWR